MGKLGKLMTKLLILDINGLLCRKVKKDYLGPVDLELATYRVVRRPGYSEFLATCYANFTVGFFSSTTRKNGDQILQILLTDQQRKDTLFFWYRDRTSLDPDWPSTTQPITCHPSWSLEDIDDWSAQGVEEYATIKNLVSVWANPIINWDRRFSLLNTIICDDSTIKLRFNRKENCLLVPSFVTPEDEVLPNLGEKINCKFEILAQIGD